MNKYTLENIHKAVIASKGLTSSICMVDGIENPVSVTQMVNEDMMILESDPMAGVTPHFRHKDTIATVVFPKVRINLPNGGVWSMDARDPGDYLPPSAGCAG